MAYSNNHYIPQLVLRRFGNKLNRYNLHTGEVICKGSIEKAFAEKDFYPLWLELKFRDVESRFATLLDKKILKAETTVNLTWPEIWLIKKFFAIATLRVPNSILYGQRHLDSVEDLKRDGFVEVTIEGESDIDYAYRTLKVLIESTSLKNLYEHPEVTYEACKWGTLFNCCYISIWDSSKANEDFIITDDGMNCEHDKSRFATLFVRGNTYYNYRDEMIKKGYVLRKIDQHKNSNPRKAFYYYQLLETKMKYVHANYYLFAVSNTRTISLINPFFRLFDEVNEIKVTEEIPNVWPTLLSKEAMKPNTVTRDKPGEHSEKDVFHYEIKDLCLDDVIIINAMMLDRVCEWLGYDDSSKIRRSLNVYSLLPREKQRNHFDGLIDYLTSMGIEFSKAQKYRDICNKLHNLTFSEEEKKCIEFFYNLIQLK